MNDLTKMLLSNKFKEFVELIRILKIEISSDSESDDSEFSNDKSSDDKFNHDKSSHDNKNDENFVYKFVMFCCICMCKRLYSYIVKITSEEDYTETNHMISMQHEFIKL